MPTTNLVNLREGDRRKAFYTAQERAVIDPFKEIYLKAVSPQERKEVAAKQILPALFELWEKQGRDLSDETACRKVTLVELYFD